MVLPLALLECFFVVTLFGFSAAPWGYWLEVFRIAQWNQNEARRSGAERLEQSVRGTPMMGPGKPGPVSSCQSPGPCIAQFSRPITPSAFSETVGRHKSLLGLTLLRSAITDCTWQSDLCVRQSQS